MQEDSIAKATHKLTVVSETDTFLYHIAIFGLSGKFFDFYGPFKVYADLFPYFDEFSNTHPFEVDTSNWVTVYYPPGKTLKVPIFNRNDATHFDLGQPNDKNEIPRPALRVFREDNAQVYAHLPKTVQVVLSHEPLKYKSPEETLEFVNPWEPWTVPAWPKATNLVGTYPGNADYPASSRAHDALQAKFAGGPIPLYAKPRVENPHVDFDLYLHIDILRDTVSDALIFTRLGTEDTAAEDDERRRKAMCVDRRPVRKDTIPAGVGLNKMSFPEIGRQLLQN